MRWTQGFIAVDWGTTNRRAYKLDSGGACTEDFEDSAGVLAIDPGGFPAAAEQIRERLGDLPMLLAGMVGSSRGWIEAPYVQCPATVGDLAERLSWIDPQRTAIVPGLSVELPGHWDVMRGEEMQLFGAIDNSLIPRSALVCHPGTHNKWIRVEEGLITDFKTVMTGEMFNLLRSQGILAEFLGNSVVPCDSFLQGVRRGLERPVLTAELFSVRARVLLGTIMREAASAYTSGLLVGLDLAIGLELAGELDFIIMGRPELTQLYAAASAEAGRSCEVVDGADAFLAGARALARTIT